MPDELDPSYKGSVSSALTSWPLVQESCRVFDVSFQQAQGKLMAHDFYVGPTDRLPFAVVAEVLAAEGYGREGLRRVRP